MSEFRVHGYKQAREVILAVFMRAIQEGAVDLRIACKEQPSEFARLASAFAWLGEDHISKRVMAAADQAAIPAPTAEPTA